jgi:hypothetical protein
MRHEMTGSFQPVMMLAAMIETRLRSASFASPALSDIVKNSTEMRTFVSTTARMNLDLIGWLTLDIGERLSLDQGVKEASQLLASGLSFRGFTLVNQTEGVTDEVARDHLRGGFVAALLALTDAAATPTNVFITANRDGQHMLVKILLMDVEANRGRTTPHEEFQCDLVYRKIAWDDVQAIANVDGLSITREAGSVVLHLPLSST